VDQNVLLDVESMESPVQANLEEVSPPASVATPCKSSPILTWAPLAWISALMLVSFYPMLERLVNQRMNDDDMGQGFFVPAVAAYIAWQ